VSVWSKQDTLGPVNCFPRVVCHEVRKQPQLEGTPILGNAAGS
jgi:hypothetical protein